MRFARLLPLLNAALALWLLATPLHAQDDPQAARQWFELAQKAYQRGDYRVAAEAFETAHAKAPHGGASFAAGLAWDKAGERGRAADALSAALSSGELPNDKRAVARTRLAALTSELARLELQPTGGILISVAHVADARTARTVHVEPGKHTASAVWPDGHRARTRVLVEAGDVFPVRFERPRSTAVGPSPAPTVREEQAQASAGPTPLAWVALGGAGLLTVTGTALTLRGLEKRDDFEADGSVNEADRDAAIELRTWAQISFVGAAALAATGVVLWLGADGSSANARKPASAVRATRRGIGFAF
jgi:hypothetical protein